MSEFENKNVLVGIANGGEESMNVDDIKDWDIKKVSHVGSTVYFEHDGTFLSMETSDFNDIFGHKMVK